MRTIVKYIQDYDIVIYKMDPEINKLLQNQKDKRLDTDEEIDESPMKAN